MKTMSEENKKELEKLVELVYGILKEADVPYQYEVAFNIANNADDCAKAIVEQSIRDVKSLRNLHKNK